VWAELLNEIDKAIDIVLHSGCLFDVEELANEEFMLIAAKALTNQAVEGRPV
jgi:hypothetical protein